MLPPSAVMILIRSDLPATAGILRRSDDDAGCSGISFRDVGGKL